MGESVFFLQKVSRFISFPHKHLINSIILEHSCKIIYLVNLGIHVEEPQPAIPPEKPVQDYSHEAEEYEKKLIQVRFS